jgi:hypothetical protein
LDHRADKTGCCSDALQLAKGRSQGEHRRDAIVLDAAFSLGEAFIEPMISLSVMRDAQDDLFAFVEERLQERPVSLAPSRHTKIMTCGEDRRAGRRHATTAALSAPDPELVEHAVLESQHA